jgi:hypothetical protein
MAFKQAYTCLVFYLDIFTAAYIIRQSKTPCEMVESANRARSMGASASVGAGV